MRPLQLLAVALVLALPAGAAGCAEAGGPGRLGDLLEIMPAEAAQRGLFYTRLGAGAGFGSALPLGRAGDLLDVDPADLTDVLETGGAPLTALAGGVRERRVRDAVAAHGYATETVGEWTIFTRGDAAPDAGPLGAAVPAGAVRRGVLVLGDPAEVHAAATGDDPVAGVAGVSALASSLTDATAAALLVSPERIVAAAAPEGGVATALERAGARGDLPAWDAAALAFGPDEEGSDGVVVLAYDGPVDGHEAARALVLRAATSPLLGEGRLATSDLFERGAPRWLDDAGVVRLPVRWRESDPAAVRAAVDEGALLFLAPAGP